MSQTVDANVLLYASDVSSPRQARARALLETIAAGPELTYIFWPTIIAYLRIATHPAVFAQPLPASDAIANVEALLDRHPAGTNEFFGLAPRGHAARGEDPLQTLTRIGMGFIAWFV